MKKIILISSLLAAGTLAANAVTTIDVTTVATDNLVLYWDFESSSPNVNTGSVSLSYSNRVQDSTTENYYNSANYIKDENKNVTTNEGRLYSTNLSNAGMYANSFTISFDISNFTSADWGNVFSLYTNGSTGIKNALMVQKDNTGKVMLYIGGIENNKSSEYYFGGASTSADVDFASYSTASGSDWTTLTFSSNGTSFKTYVNGVLIATEALETTETALTGFQFATTLANGGHDATTLNFDNIAFWNTTLTDTQVASLCATPVPEPSFFGLFAGTLALGLAGTRRRRAK